MGVVRAVMVVRVSRLASLASVKFQQARCDTEGCALPRLARANCAKGTVAEAGRELPDPRRSRLILDPSTPSTPSLACLVLNSSACMLQLQPASPRRTPHAHAQREQYPDLVPNARPGG